MKKRFKIALATLALASYQNCLAMLNPRIALLSWCKTLNLTNLTLTQNPPTPLPLNQKREYAHSAWKHIKTLKNPSARINDVTFMPDDKSVISASTNKTVKKWNIDTGQCIQTFKGHTQWVTKVAYCPTTKAIISSCGDGTIHIWNEDTRESTRRLWGQEGWVNDFALLPKGLIASICHRGYIKIWDPRATFCLKTIKSPDSWIKSIDTFNNGQIALTASADGRIRLWDIKSGQCIKTINAHSKALEKVVALPDGHSIAAACQDGTITVWDALSEHRIKTIEAHSKSIKDLILGPDGTLISSSDDNTIKFWDVATGQCCTTITSKSPVTSISISNHGELLALAHENNIEIWKKMLAKYALQAALMQKWYNLGWSRPQ